MAFNNLKHSRYMRLENWAIFKLLPESQRIATPCIMLNLAGMALESELSEEELKCSSYIALGEIRTPGLFGSKKLVFSSVISKYSNKTIQLASGTFFRLGKMHPNYATFVENAKNHQILINWSFGVLAISENEPLSTGTYTGRYIKGSIRGKHGEHITKRITAQNGNIITCHDGSEYCIDWAAINPTLRYKWHLAHKSYEISHFKTFPLFQCDSLGIAIVYSFDFFESQFDYLSFETQIPFSVGCACGFVNLDESK